MTYLWIFTNIHNDTIPQLHRKSFIFWAETKNLFLFCLQAPGYGLTLWCALGLSVGGTIQVHQLQFGGIFLHHISIPPNTLNHNYTPTLVHHNKQPMRKISVSKICRADYVNCCCLHCIASVTCHSFVMKSAGLLQRSAGRRLWLSFRSDRSTDCHE